MTTRVGAPFKVPSRRISLHRWWSCSFVAATSWAAVIAAVRHQRWAPGRPPLPQSSVSKPTQRPTGVARPTGTVVCRPAVGPWRAASVRVLRPPKAIARPYWRTLWCCPKAAWLTLVSNTSADHAPDLRKRISFVLCLFQPISSFKNTRSTLSCHTVFRPLKIRNYI